MSSSTDSRLQKLFELKYDVVADLYRQRAKHIAARRHGLDSFLIELFGPDLVGSIACLLDPYWQLVQVGKVKGPKSLLISTLFPITPVPAKRLRRFEGILPAAVHDKWHGRSQACQNGNATTSMGCNPPLITNGDSVLTTQFRVQGWTLDTTDSIRNPNNGGAKDMTGFKQSQGEFELFRPRLKMFDTHLKTYADNESYGTNPGGFSSAKSYTDEVITPYIGAAPSSSVISWAASEKTYATSLMVKNLDSMLARCVPTRRYFNLAYQIGELKDVPGTIRGSLYHWKLLQRQIGKDGFIRSISHRSWWTKDRVRRLAPYLERVGVHDPLDRKISDVYLNFKFGWESLYQAAVKLVTTPQRVTKEVNYLISRNGKFTNLATTKSWSEPIAAPILCAVPIATHATLYSGVPPVAEGLRRINLRCMCNVGFYFPPLAIPRLRSELFYDKLGLVPTPADLFDLVPWTWMIDWFVGLGDYVHLMDRINGQSNLINYGFMTYKSTSQHRTKWTLIQKSNVTRTVVGQTPVSTDIITPVHLTFGPDIDYELRYSLARLASIRTYSGTGLNQDQKTILGALFSKFT